MIYKINLKQNNINFPKILNNVIENNKSEKYIMFIYEDLYDNIIDIDDFNNKYIKLMEKYKLPFLFYPYYIHFNKVLPDTLSLAHPKINVIINKQNEFNIVKDTSYGMLIIDNELLQKFKFNFNEKYKTSFYIQELVEFCYKNNLYFSNSWFFDVYHSNELVKSNMKNGFKILENDFMKEKDEFYKNSNKSSNTINEFMDKLTKYVKKINNLE